MGLLRVFWTVTSIVAAVNAVILQNGQVRETHFLDTRTDSIGNGWNATAWSTYGANSTELSYKGRWDSQYISWWAAPGLKFAFEGEDVAITFGQYTSNGVLVAYRVGGLDWQFTNITANATHHLVAPSTPGLNLTQADQRPLTFEMRVTNWGYGVQVSAVHLSAGSRLVKIPNFSRSIEFIGDSLTAGMYATYEAFSGFGYMIGAGFGDVEFSVTAHPGICLHDANCWGNPRGQEHQWFETYDTNGRAQQIHGNRSEPWDFSAHQPADLILINLGTNDNNTANNVTNEEYYNSYISFISKVHDVYPNAQIIIMSLWNGFSQVGNTYREVGAFKDEIYAVYKHYEIEGYVHYFNSTGILQHNDIGPQYHPTDFGHIKIASHVLQYIRIKLGWEFAATGPEVQHETLYWNDESGY